MESPWKSLTQKPIYSNSWISVTEHQVINPNGGEGIYGVVNFKNLAIGVVALDENLNIWLVGQFRFPINQFSWEIPEGGGPLSDDPLLSAKRELKEETGLEANYWKEILRMHLSNSVSDELSIIYLATGLIEGVSNPEETEKLNVQKVSFIEAYNRVLAGEITDSISVAAILKTKILLDRVNGNLHKITSF